MIDEIDIHRYIHQLRFNIRRTLTGCAACTTDICIPTLINPIRVRSRGGHDSKIKAKARVIDYSRSRIENTVICAKAHIVIARILNYIDIGLLFRISLNFFCFHAKKGIMRKLIKQ